MMKRSLAAAPGTKVWPDGAREHLGLFLITLPPEVAQYINILITAGFIQMHTRHRQIYVAYGEMHEWLPPDFEPGDLWADIENWDGFMPLVPYCSEREAHHNLVYSVPAPEPQRWAYPVDQLPRQQQSTSKDFQTIDVGGRKFLTEWPLIADLDREDLDALRPLRIDLSTLEETPQIPSGTSTKPREP